MITIIVDAWTHNMRTLITVEESCTCLTLRAMYYAMTKTPLTHEVIFRFNSEIMDPKKTLAELKMLNLDTIFCDISEKKKNDKNT